MECGDNTIRCPNSPYETIIEQEPPKDEAITLIDLTPNNATDTDIFVYEFVNFFERLYLDIYHAVTSFNFV